MCQNRKWTFLAHHHKQIEKSTTVLRYYGTVGNDDDGFWKIIGFLNGKNIDQKILTKKTQSI